MVERSGSKSEEQDMCVPSRNVFCKLEAQSAAGSDHEAVSLLVATAFSLDARRRHIAADLVDTRWYDITLVRRRPNVLLPRPRKERRVGQVLVVDRGAGVPSHHPSRRQRGRTKNPRNHDMNPGAEIISGHDTQYRKNRGKGDRANPSVQLRSANYLKHPSVHDFRRWVLYVRGRM